MAASDPSTTEPQSSPPHPPSLSAVLSESLRIIKSHFPQLLFLSSLYLFPKTFASIAHPTRQSLIKAHRPFPPTYQPETLLALVFSVYSSVVSVSGYVFYSLGLWYVTHTVGKPTTRNSVSVSVLPLLGTVLIALPNLVTLFSLVDLGQCMFRVYQGVSESEVDAMWVVFFIGCVNIHVHHAIVAPIVVVESGELMESLKRSSKLMKGRRMVALSMLVVFGSVAVVLGFVSSWILEAHIGLFGDLSGGGWWRMMTPEFVFRIVMASGVFMVVLLWNAVANTVLYVHCTKAE